MQQFMIFLKLNAKRMLRLFLSLFLTTLVVICAAFLLLAVTKATDEESAAKRLTIGITVREDDMDYMELGLSLMQSLDSSKHSLQLEAVSYNEGEQRMQEGTLDAWILIPDNYIRDTYYGTESPIEFYFGKSEAGITSLLVRGIADAVSNLVLRSKTGVYAMQNLYSAHGIPYTGAADELTRDYILRILGREQFTQTEEIHSTGYTDTATYYFCVALVLLFLLWGLNCGSLFSGEHPQMKYLLQRNGLSFRKQLLAKYINLFVLFLLNLALLVLVLSAVFSFTGLSLPGADSRSGIPKVLSLIKTAAVFPLICSFVFLVYETAKEVVGGTVFFFFSILIVGFLSGCFYPLTYFPAWMQSLAESLPARVLFRYIASCITGKDTGTEFLFLIIYTLLFTLPLFVFTGNGLRRKTLKSIVE